MKKTLMTLAALAASGAALAQSNVTLYGIVDASFERQKGGTDSVNKVSSGQLSGSRWGLRGSEDLGGGLKGVFTLESGINVDDGTTGQAIPASKRTTASGSNPVGSYNSVLVPNDTPATNRLFSRQAFVGVEGGFGSVRLGRQYSPIGVVADLVGITSLDVLNVAGTLAAVDGYRADNAINYKTPSFGGFTAEAQYSFGLNGTEASGQKGGRAYSLNGMYANGPITAALGYMTIIDANYVQPGDQKRKGLLAVAGYDFGMAKLMGFYSQTDLIALTAPAATTGPTFGVTAPAANKMKVYGLRGDIPFGAFTLTPVLSKIKDGKGSAAAASDDAKVFSLVAAYDLSKRTTLYGRVTTVSNDANSNKGFNTPVNDKSSNALNLGIRHRF